ncbi:MAG: mannose-1-phosphate guanylyltransferase [Treponemataceae bacterium]|nr:MAG: mannose-1-phosphate guanylyltransferase [Treponemataceae bacterium]
MFTDVLILAGGSGERLWPASTHENPKQFMRVFDNYSFLQETVFRALCLNVAGRIIVVTRTIWLSKVSTEIAEMKKDLSARRKKDLDEKILLFGEERGKNTAPALALVCSFLKTANILILPSDHIILNKTSFIRDMESAAAISATDKIVLFGIKGETPETGYGYIQVEENSIKNSENAYKITHFKEKPDSQTATRYIADPKYYWNSGIYCVTADFFMHELSLYAPETFACFSHLFEASHENAYEIEKIFSVTKNQDGFYVLRDSVAIQEAYQKTPAISIDLAISEKSNNAVAIKASFDWDDAGTWDSISKYTQIATENEEIHAKNNFAYSDIPVTFVGTENLIAVVQNGKLCIIQKGHSNEIKERKNEM